MYDQDAVVSLFLSGKSVPDIVVALGGPAPSGTRTYRVARQTVEDTIRDRLDPGRLGDADREQRLASDAEALTTPLLDGDELSHDFAVRARKHGLSANEVRLILERQQYQCPICKTGLTLENSRIDHSHSCHPGPVGCYRCVRGVLCHGCNSWLFYGLSPALLRRGADYLEKGQGGLA
jgi:Recombination endonuclease VII